MDNFDLRHDPVRVRGANTSSIPFDLLKLLVHINIHMQFAEYVRAIQELPHDCDEKDDALDVTTV